MSEARGDATVAALPAGHVLDGRYRIEATLGQGGIGVVYRAQHLRLGRAVAVKMLHPCYGNHGEIRARFEREAKTLSALAHPHIVAVSDCGRVDGMLYLVMELLEGQTLAELLDEGPLDPDVAIDMAKDALRGLAFAHARGVLHRDIKPGNVFLERGEDGKPRVKLFDFGLAKLGEPEVADQRGGPLTRVGTVMGTPAYMSPEQGAAGATDARSDVYSMGIVLFEMLTGQRPFEEEGIAEMLRAHLVKPVPDPEALRPGLTLSPELRAVLARSLAKKRDARFADAGAMLEALEALPRPAAWIGKARPRDRSLAATTPKATQPRPARRTGGRLVAGAVSAATLAALVAWAGPDVGASTEGLVAPPDDLAPPRVETASPTASDVRAPAIDPLASVPRELRGMHSLVRRGRELGDAQIRALRAYQQSHPGDATASLILAHDHFQRQWLTAALERYDLAHRIDPSARGCAWMQEDLVAMARTPASSRQAGQVIAEIYGSEALPAVTAALASADLDASGRARLDRLRDRLAQSSP